MNCLKCNNNLNPDDIFCRNCGSSINIKVCPKCGQTTAKSSNFCKSCAYQFTNDSICDCGAQIKVDDLFCRSCGRLLRKMPAPIQQKDHTKRNKIFEIINASLVLVGLLMLFIACFTPMYTVTINNFPVESNNMFYHFFKDIYKNITYSQDLLEFYFAVISSILVALNMLVCCIMLILGSIHFGRYFINKAKPTFVKYLACASISTLTLTCWLSNLFDMPGIYKYGLMTEFKIAPYFVITLFLCFIFIFTSSLLNLIAKHDRKIKTNLLASSILQLISCLTIIFIMIFSSLHTLGSLNFDGVSSATIFNTLTELQKYDSHFNSGLFYARLLFFSYLALIVCCIILFILIVSKLNGEQPYKQHKKISFALGTTIFLLMVLKYICAIMICNNLEIINSISTFFVIASFWAICLFGLQIANFAIKSKKLEMSKNS